MTAIKIALKEIHKREEKRWVIYKDSQNSMQSIEYNKENYPILNQIYILVELQAQDKNITLFKVPAHMGIKKTNNRYARNDHNKITLYRLLLGH